MAHSCPRLPIWEEAIANGLVRRTNGASMREAKVDITDKGRQALNTAHIRLLRPSLAGSRPGQLSNSLYKTDAMGRVRSCNQRGSCYADELRGGQFHLIDERRVVVVGARAVHAFGYRPFL